MRPVEVAWVDGEFSVRVALSAFRGFIGVLIIRRVKVYLALHVFLSYFDWLSFRVPLGNLDRFDKLWVWSTNLAFLVGWGAIGLLLYRFEELCVKLLSPQEASPVKGLGHFLWLLFLLRLELDWLTKRS